MLKSERLLRGRAPSTACAISHSQSSGMLDFNHDPAWFSAKDKARVLCSSAYAASGTLVSVKDKARANVRLESSSSMWQRNGSLPGLLLVSTEKRPLANMWRTGSLSQASVRGGWRRLPHGHDSKQPRPAGVPVTLAAAPTAVRAPALLFQKRLLGPAVRAGPAVAAAPQPRSNLPLALHCAVETKTPHNFVCCGGRFQPHMPAAPCGFPPYCCVSMASHMKPLVSNGRSSTSRKRSVWLGAALHASM